MGELCLGRLGALSAQLAPQLQRLVSPLLPVVTVAEDELPIHIRHSKHLGAVLSVLEELLIEVVGRVVVLGAAVLLLDEALAAVTGALSACCRIDSNAASYAAAYAAFHAASYLPSRAACHVALHAASTSAYCVTSTTAAHADAVKFQIGVHFGL